MLSKTVHSISRTTTDMFNTSVDLVRGLTLREAQDLFRFARRRLGQERLPQVAGSLTFTTVLALVPLLTIALAIFTTFPMFGTLRKTLEAYFVQSMMPKGMAATVLGYLTTFANKATRLSAVGAVALVFTSVMMMGMIERAFNQIWRVRRPRPITQRVLIYWALVTLGPLLFGLSLTVTSQVFMATSGIVSAVPLLGTMFYTTLSVALTTGAYTLLYMAIPNRYVDWHDAVWGGLVAALAFEAAKRLFAVFIQMFPAYAVIYGALAAVPLLLIWIYLSWLITLVGALLVSALPIVKYERWWYEPVPGGEFVDAMAVLKVLYISGKVNNSALVNSSYIRAHTRIGYDEMTDLLEKMLAVGWVGRVKKEAPKRVQWGKRVREETDNWVLLVNADKIKVSEVYRLFVFGGMTVDAGVSIELDPDSPMTLDAGALARRVEDAVEYGLGQSLAENFAGALPSLGGEPE